MLTCPAHHRHRRRRSCSPPPPLPPGAPPAAQPQAGAEAAEATGTAHKTAPVQETGTGVVRSVEEAGHRAMVSSAHHHQQCGCGSPAGPGQPTNLTPPGPVRTQEQQGADNPGGPGRPRCIPWLCSAMLPCPIACLFASLRATAAHHTCPHPSHPTPSTPFQAQAGTRRRPGWGKPCSAARTKWLRRSEEQLSKQSEGPSGEGP